MVYSECRREKEKDKKNIEKGIDTGCSLCIIGSDSKKNKKEKRQ